MEQLLGLDEEIRRGERWVQTHANQILDKERYITRLKVTRERLNRGEQITATEIVDGVAISAIPEFVQGRIVLETEQLEILNNSLAEGITTLNEIKQRRLDLLENLPRDVIDAYNRELRSLAWAAFENQLRTPGDRAATEALYLTLENQLENFNLTPARAEDLVHMINNISSGIKKCLKCQKQIYSPRYQLINLLKSGF